MCHKNVSIAVLDYITFYPENFGCDQKMKQRDYLYVLRTKEDHQRSKITFTEFERTGPDIVEKVLP